ncbi:glycosyltransferase family 4 protein [Candidatus Sumerlaeota bacterium]|nr:glycosyltransferase family 4 protein [Candidatus Sumerlaeota bacterium]
MTPEAQPHIALLVKALPCHQAGGLEFHALELAHGLIRIGFRTTILTSALPDQPAIEMGDAPLEILYAEDGAPGRYSRTYFRETNRLLAELHQRDPLDLIHAQEFSAMYLQRPAPDLPLISTIHGTLYSETPLSPVIFQRGAWWRRLLWLWQFKHRIMLRGRYRRLLQESDSIIVDSEFTRNELMLENVPEQKMHVAPLGVPHSISSLPSAHACQSRTKLDRPYVLTVSRLTWIKGVDLGIEAMAKSRSRVDYVIIGDGPEKSRLERLAKRYPDFRVHFRSNVPVADLPYYYAGARLALMPERNQPAFGLTALEANLMGTPVLAARTGALPEVLGEHGGWFFDRGNVQQCAGTLLGLLANPKALRDQGVKARESALRRFSVDQMARNTAEAYKKLLKK